MTLSTNRRLLNISIDRDEPSLASPRSEVWVGGQIITLGERCLIRAPFLSQQATRILGLNPGLPRRVSVSPTCPLVHLCLFFETGWGHDTPSLPPYECQGVGFFCYPFYYEAPEVLGCIHQWSSFPVYNRNLSSGCSAAFAACCPEPFMGIPSWVDCQPKPPLLRAVHLG